MNLNSNGYVLAFAVSTCVVISAALALTATALKPEQIAAAEFDRQKNVMLAAGLIEAADPRPRAELEALYAQRVEEVVVDSKTGETVQQGSPNDPAADKSAEPAASVRTVALTRDAAGKLAAIVLPVSGRGLWSTLHGYLALEADGNHVRGITFYKHGETPGLGGEVENPDWTAQWKGKTIYDASGKLRSIDVKKGKVDPSIPAEKAHAVDGLSGATITCNGVENFVRADLTAFEPFLRKVAQKEQR